MNWLKQHVALLASMTLNVLLVAGLLYQAREIMILKMDLAQLTFILKLIMSQGVGGGPVQ